MANKIITISREFGSGGRFIGEEVAKKLGMKYYDKDIISQIAEKLGFSKEYISQNAELSPKKGLFAYALTGRLEEKSYLCRQRIAEQSAGKKTGLEMPSVQSR